MSDAADPEPTLDGRAARRERNIALVLDTVVEMFSENAMVPTIEQVANRSGLSVRSLYRYFADPDELAEAAIERNRRRAVTLATIEAIGEGPLDRRVDDFVASRWRLYDAMGAAFRASVHHALRQPRLAALLGRRRDELRRQLEEQFAPELAALAADERAVVVAAADALTQPDALELLARHRGLPGEQVEAVLRRGLLALLRS